MKLRWPTTQPGKPRPMAERFWEKVDRSGGPDACWPWIAAINKYGYGHFRKNGEIVRANRLAVVLGSPDGRVPPRDLADGDLVRHSRQCHESGIGKRCTNPAHLTPGDYSENLQDAYDHGARPRRPQWMKEPKALSAHQGAA